MTFREFFSNLLVSFPASTHSHIHTSTLPHIKVITQLCSYDDPVRGPSVWRSVTRLKDDNSQEFEMFITPKGGKEEKMMEMTVTRKVAAVRKAA